MEDDRAETRWLSYDELAEIRGISRESATRIARLRRWPKRNGNDGTIRVAVPLNFLQTKRRDRPEASAESRAEIPPEMSTTIKALEGQIAAKDAHIATLADALADVRGERDRLLVQNGELQRQLEEARAVVAPKGNKREVRQAAERPPLAEVPHSQPEAGPSPPLAEVTQPTDHVAKPPLTETQHEPAGRPRRWWQRLLRR